MKICTPRSCLVVLAAVAGLSACSNDSFIARSFSSKPPETLAPSGGYGPEVQDSRPLIAEITALQVDNNPGGAVIRATGVAAGQGYWDAELVRAASDADSPSELRLDFRVRPPQTPAPVGSPRSREVTVATFATTYDLDGIRSITVNGAQNSRSTRR